MDGIKKNAKTAAKVAKVFKVFAIVGVAGMLIMAVMGFVLTGFINQYYENPDNVAAAAGSLNADMGIFSFINFQKFADSGNYALFFSVQSICAAISFLPFIYLFSVLQKNLNNISDYGYAFSMDEAAKTKTSYIIITIILALFNDLTTGVIAGLVLCALYLATKALNLKDESRI